MISQIQGVLTDVSGQSAFLRMDHSAGSVTYEVLMPAYTAARLAADRSQIGKPFTFHTLHYLESQSQGAMMVPRLAGFTSPHDRQFFELFTTVKGIGQRKALRAMSLTIGQIAGAIADRDVAM